jgi:hypothetical protein
VLYTINYPEESVLNYFYPVTAHAPGTTTITAGIVVEESKRGFTLDITVGAEGAVSELEAGDGTAPETEGEGGVG